MHPRRDQTTTSLCGCNAVTHLLNSNDFSRWLCVVQVWRACLDITAPGHPCVVTGRVMLTLDWLPLSPAPCAPPRPPPRLRLLGRGSLSVRVICAWDLAPMDVQAMTCNARVSMLAAGEERRTPTHASMCPVWLATERFEHISECSTLWLEVQHVTQFGSQSISRCHISIEDLAPMPNQAVLVTKCLQGWDGDPTHPQRSDLHWTAGLGARAPGDGAATEAGSPAHASAMSPGTPGRSKSEASARRSQGRRSGVFDVWGACDMHGPSALRWAAQHSAEASGSLASDSAPPPGTAPSGWLMFEVRDCRLRQAAPPCRDTDTGLRSVRLLRGCARASTPRSGHAGTASSASQ